METTLKKKLTTDQMHVLFEELNIRGYYMMDKRYHFSPPLKRQKIYYMITIRHPENTVAREIIKKILK